MRFVPSTVGPLRGASTSSSFGDLGKSMKLSGPTGHHAGKPGTARVLNTFASTRILSLLS